MNIVKKMGSPTTRAYPEFSFTEEDMKKFVGKLKITIKRVFTFKLDLIIRRNTLRYFRQKSLNVYAYSNKKFYSKAYIKNKKMIQRLLVFRNVS